MPNGAYNAEWCKERHADQQRLCDERYTGAQGRIDKMEHKLDRIRQMVFAALLATTGTFISAIVLLLRQ